MATNAGCRHADRKRAGRREAVDANQLLSLPDRVVLTVGTRPGQRADAVAGAQHVVFGDAPRNARARVEVLPVGLHAQVLGHVAISGHANRVVRGVIRHLAALRGVPDQRCVDLMTKAEIKGDVGPDLPLVVDVGVDRLVRAPAVQVFVDQPAFDALRHVEHERRERVREPVHRRAVGRERRVGAAERPRRARVRHLIEQVAVHAEVATDLHRVIAPDLGRGRRERRGALLTIPRQRRLEADEVVAVAAHVDRRDAAREIVQVDAFDAKILRGRSVP